MKRIKAVASLIEKARERMLANPEGNHGWAVLKRDGVEVYEVFAEVADTEREFALVYSLFHYGTLTARIETDLTKGDAAPELVYNYGESRSDADSVNTFCDELGVLNRFGFRPVNGGWYEA